MCGQVLTNHSVLLFLMKYHVKQGWVSLFCSTSMSGLQTKGLSREKGRNSVSPFSERSHMVCNAFWIAMTWLWALNLVLFMCSPSKQDYSHTANEPVASCHPHCSFFPTNLPTGSLSILHNAAQRHLNKEDFLCLETLHAAPSHISSCLTWSDETEFSEGSIFASPSKS